MNKIMRGFRIALALAACAASVGCGPALSELDCGQGTKVDIDGELYCVYSQAVVVEDGFLCPPGAPHQAARAPIAVCSNTPSVPMDIFDEIDEIYQPENPEIYDGYCSVTFGCAGDKVCEARMCVDPSPPAPTVCGARAGDTCSDDEYCHFDREATCGWADATGVCQPKPDACDADYTPVCGCDGQTYSNECVANAAGTGVVSDGECPDPAPIACGGIAGQTCKQGDYCSYRPEDICGAADAQGVCAPIEESACSAVFEPVCGCDGQTYSNACEAANAGTSVSSEGECEPTQPQDCGGIAGLTCPAGQFCDWAQGDICGAADALGTCQPIPEACTQEVAEVCGCDNQTYSNACEANNAGVSVASDGACSM